MRRCGGVDKRSLRNARAFLCSQAKPRLAILHAHRCCGSQAGTPPFPPRQRRSPGTTGPAATGCASACLPAPPPPAPRSGCAGAGPWWTAARAGGRAPPPTPSAPAAGPPPWLCLVCNTSGLAEARLWLHPRLPRAYWASFPAVPGMPPPGSLQPSTWGAAISPFHPTKCVPGVLEGRLLLFN